MSTTVSLELDNKPNREGLHSIMVRVTENRKSKRKSTGIKVPKASFNKVAMYGKWIRSNHPDHIRLNGLLKQKREELEKGIQLSESTGLTFIDIGKQDFFAFAKVNIERYEKQQKFRTTEKRQHIINKLAKYIGGDYLPFNKIKVSFLKDYEAYLAEKGNKINTINTDLKGIRAIINAAAQEGLIEQSQNPFLNFRLKSEKTYKDKLTLDEMKQFTDFKCEEGSLIWKVKKYFLFSYYCGGIRFGDFTQLRWSNIKEGRLIYTMDKTAGTAGSFKNIVLVPKALEILELFKVWNPGELNNYIFPILSKELDQVNLKEVKKEIGRKNALINKYLGLIQKRAEIQIKISFHISRHSFADHARQKGVSIYDIKAALGHSTIQQTQTYLAQFDNDSSDALFNRMFNSDK